MSINKNLDPASENLSTAEKEIERALRPLSFDDFAGQRKVTENLTVFVKAAVQRGEALDHFAAWPSGLRQNYISQHYCKRA